MLYGGMYALNMTIIIGTHLKRLAGGSTGDGDVRFGAAALHRQVVCRYGGRNRARKVRDKPSSITSGQLIT